MRYWEIFWTVGLLVAGASFAFITLVVTVKGAQDLREMFRRLHAQTNEREQP